ncbi:hypothetical protein KC317_g19248, partial [Hortaea werneckii]
MVSLKLTTLALAALHTLGAVAQIPEGLSVEDVEELPDEVTSDPEDNSKTPNLAVDITTSFPDAEVFGVKLVNGRPTRAILDVSNNEPEAVNLMVVGGSLTTPVDAPG